MSARGISGLIFWQINWKIGAVIMTMNQITVMTISPNKGVNMNGFEFCRLRAGLKQVEVAEAMKVSQGTVSSWEQGYSYPTGSKVPALARLYRCSIDDLYKGAEEKKPRISKRKREMLEFMNRK